MSLITVLPTPSTVPVTTPSPAMALAWNAPRWTRYPHVDTSVSDTVNTLCRTFDYMGLCTPLVLLSDVAPGTPEASSRMVRQWRTIYVDQMHDDNGQEIPEGSWGDVERISFRVHLGMATIPPPRQCDVNWGCLELQELTSSSILFSVKSCPFDEVSVAQAMMEGLKNKASWVLTKPRVSIYFDDEAACWI